MEPVRIIEGAVLPLDRADVDTDQIMPKQFLTRVERTGFGAFVFHDWRIDPAFVLNDERYAGAPILVSGPNFGSGSSREHAPWGLHEYGFRAIVAPSFADIFAANCAKIGLLTVELPGPVCRDLLARAAERPTASARIDLEQELVTFDGRSESFRLDPHRRRMLLEGLDEIELSLARAEEIADHEASRPAWLPTTTDTGRRTAPRGLPIVPR